MAILDDIRDIFGILHDGEIIAWEGDHSRLILTIECKYLARQLDDSFDCFIVELNDVHDLQFKTWTDPVFFPSTILTNPADVFRGSLIILSANVHHGEVILECNQGDHMLHYNGGNMTIVAGGIKLFDQIGQPMSIDALDAISRDYWKNWQEALGDFRGA
jgi:hypothetical protein